MTALLILYALLLHTTHQQWRKVQADERTLCGLCGERHTTLYRQALYRARPLWTCWHCTRVMTAVRHYA